MAGEISSERLHTLIKNLGISPALSGYGYIAEAVRIYIEGGRLPKSITKTAYDEVAAIFGVTRWNVERCIRTAIERAFDNLSPEIIFAVFGNSVSADRGRPTNSEFIATVAEVLTSEPNNPVWRM